MSTTKLSSEKGELITWYTLGGREGSWAENVRLRKEGGAHAVGESNTNRNQPYSMMRSDRGFLKDLL